MQVRNSGAALTVGSLALLLVAAGCNWSRPEQGPVDFEVTFVGELEGRTLQIDGVERTEYAVTYPDLRAVGGSTVTWELRNDVGDTLQTGSWDPYDFLFDPGFGDSVYTSIYSQECLVPWGTWRHDFHGYVDDGYDYRTDYGCRAQCDPAEPHCEPPFQRCAALELTADDRYHELGCVEDVNPGHLEGSSCSWSAGSDNWIWDDCAAGMYCYEGFCRPMCSDATVCATDCVTLPGYPPELTVCLP
jgi:hypothetical protein